MKKSIVRRIAFLMAVQVFLSIAAFMVFLTFFYVDAKREIQQSSKNFLQVYGNEIKNRLHSVDGILEKLIYQNTVLLQLESSKQLERYYASLEVHTQIQELLAVDDSAEILVVAEGEYGTCLDAESINISYEQRQALRQFAVDRTTGEQQDTHWYFAEIGGTNYLCKMYMKGKRIEAAFISADRLLDFIDQADYGTQIFTISDAENKIWSFMGKDMEVIQLNDLLDKIGKSFREQVQYTIVEDEIYLSAYVDMYHVLDSMRYSVYMIIALAVFNAFYVFFTVKYTNNRLLKPVQRIIGIMDGIGNGNYELRIEEDFEHLEFYKLKETFNHLMDEVIHLRIQKYEKRLELRDVEMKCVRLTLRPHFFLNAVTTISSLSMQKKNEEIVAYVKALSKTIRYMFRSGLHTVRISEEVEHVENYFEMQNLRYPDAVVHFIELEKECGDWLIPQLLIHTVIENEYKYAVNTERTLTILISIKKVWHGESEMLSIEIEDDGTGYPDEMFVKMQTQPGNYPSDGKRIGLWSVRKMLELMYERGDLFQIENIQPHGCMNRILLPREPVHELKEETIQNKIE